MTYQHERWVGGRSEKTTMDWSIFVNVLNVQWRSIQTGLFEIIFVKYHNGLLCE